jgi:hypothetical protein
MIDYGTGTEVHLATPSCGGRYGTPYIHLRKKKEQMRRRRSSTVA